MLYDKLMSQGKQKVQAAPPAAKPGSKAPQNTATKQAELRKQLKRSGDSNLAAKLIERML
jgi:hypothetical protein